MQDASLGGSMLGYYDFGARFYNPMYGRWFNMDPARQFENPFTYCGNNPIVFIDPNGEEAYYMDADGYVQQRYSYGPNPFPDYPEFYDFLARTSDRDMLYTYDSYGNYQMTFVDDTDFLKNFSKKNENRNGYEGNYGTTSNAGDAFNVFKFGADYSKVEWKLNAYSTPIGNQYLLYTQHYPSEAENFDGSFSEKNMLFDLHSHPGGGLPSGYIYSAPPNSRVTDYYRLTDGSFVAGRYKRLGNSYPNHYVYNPKQATIYHYTPWAHINKEFQKIATPAQMKNVIYNKNYN